MVAVAVRQSHAEADDTLHVRSEMGMSGQELGCHCKMGAVPGGGCPTLDRGKCESAVAVAGANAAAVAAADIGYTVASRDAAVVPLPAATVLSAKETAERSRETAVHTELDSAPRVERDGRRIQLAQNLSPMSAGTLPLSQSVVFRSVAAIASPRKQTLAPVLASRIGSYETSMFEGQDYK